MNLLEPETEHDKSNLADFKGLVSQFTNEGGNFRFGTDMDAWGEQIPPKGLQEFGYSLALINVDNAAFAKDDVSRRPF